MKNCHCGSRRWFLEEVNKIILWWKMHYFGNGACRLSVFVQKNERHAISHSRISLNRSCNHSSELRLFVLYMFECKTNENRRSHLEILVSWQSSILGCNPITRRTTYVRPIISCIYYSNGIEKWFQSNYTELQITKSRAACIRCLLLWHISLYFGLDDFFFNSMFLFHQSASKCSFFVRLKSINPV